MVSLREVQAELQRLYEQSERARRSGKAEALARIRAWIDEYQLTETELGLGPVKHIGPPGVARYRDPQTGRTWTGRGRVPKWIAGLDRTPFEIG